MPALLDVLFGSPPQKKAANGDILYLDDPDGWDNIPFGRKTVAGTVVNEDLALTYSAWLCGVRVLAEGCAMLKLTLYKGAEDGSREPATDLRGWDLTRNAPNPEMHATPFWEAKTQHQVNWGNGFAEIERLTASPESPPAALWPIHASRVSPVTKHDTNTNGAQLDPEYKYKVLNDDGTSVAMKPHELLHFPGALSEDGIWGKSLVAYARENIGLALAMERYGSTFFSSAKAPPAVIFLPGMNSSDARKNFRQEWKQIHGSSDSGEIAILPVEGDFKQVGIENEKGQFLESRVHGIKDVARILRVPVHMLAEMMGPAGYNTISMLSQEFVDYALMTWLIKQAGQCDLKLLTPQQRAEGYFYAHDLSGLLKGDAETRFKVHEIALRSGIKTPNQVCKEENIPGFGPAGDQHLVNAATTTIERIFKGEPPPSAQKQESSDAKGDRGDSGAAKADRGGVGKAEHEAAPAPRAEAADGGGLGGGPDARGGEGDATGIRHGTPGLKRAARAVLADAMKRMFTKEANAVRRKMKSPDFLNWLTDWGHDHRPSACEAVGPAASMLNAIGLSITAEQIAHRMVEESSIDLNVAYNTDSREDFGKRLDCWHHRGSILADAIMAQVPDAPPEPEPPKPKKKVKQVQRDGQGNITCVIESEE